MELQFNKTTCSCLDKRVRQVQEQEQTQELKIPDAMPDIGRVLGSWGQVLVRGKEWRTGEMSVNGGVMCWVLYEPEDGSESCTIESWIPFQIRWNIPDTRRDGIISAYPLLKGMDARCISARKLMLRSVVSVLGEAFESVDTEVFVPVSVPEDVQLLKRSYPVELPLEGGEKSFQMEDAISPPDFSKMVRYELIPQINEQKVMASRLIMRGVMKMHMLYLDPQGEMETWNTELPFAQFTDLDHEYGSGATAWIVPILNGSEIEKLENGDLLLKCAVTAQYVIYDRRMIDVVEDAYSTQRNLQTQVQDLKLPIRLDTNMRLMDCAKKIPPESGGIVDVAVFYDYPVIRHIEEVAQAEWEMQYQLLCRDENGNIQNVSLKDVCRWDIPSDFGNELYIYPLISDAAGISPNTDGLSVSAGVGTVVTASGTQGIPMVTALELGDWKEKDPTRPSVILRRNDEQSLWNIAKECGSTVEAILNVNQLQQEPMAGQMLLIPIS